MPAAGPEDGKAPAQHAVSGAILTVETTDPLAIIDIPHFCNENGHTLLSSDKTDGGHRFVIRKA